jgi:anti-sigma factor RsiW
MNTNNDYLLMNAFVDGELDLSRQLEMEERLRSDEDLARRIEELGQLRSAIREGAPYHAAPASLRSRIGTSIAPQRAKPARAAAAIAEAVHQWFDWRPLVASFAVVAAVALAVNFTWPRSSHDERLLDDVVASHVRSTLGEHLVDVASSDHHTVKPWLSSKLDFSPPVDDLRIPGSMFLGGRVDYLDGHPVAALVYRQGPHIVNSFVWPSTVAKEKPAFAEVRGFQTAHWSTNGMAHWVISDVNHTEFTSVVEAIRSGGG